MGTIRNFALAAAAGALLAAGFAAAEESKPATTPRAEQHRHGWQGNAGQEGCMGGQHAQKGERHGRMGGMHGRMAERHARMGLQHGQAGECAGAGQGGCPAMQGDAEHNHGS